MKKNTIEVIYQYVIGSRNESIYPLELNTLTPYRTNEPSTITNQSLPSHFDSRSLHNQTITAQSVNQSCNPTDEHNTVAQYNQANSGIATLVTGTT